MPKRTLTGKVVSTKMQKTVVVAVEVVRKHPMYGKVVADTRRFKARDEIKVSEGDIVKIEECQPYSKEVNWKVIEIVEAKE